MPRTVLGFLREMLFGPPGHEVVGGANGSMDMAPLAGAAAAGAIGAVTDTHRPSTLPDDDHEATTPCHGDDLLRPALPPPK